MSKCKFYLLTKHDSIEVSFFIPQESPDGLFPGERA